MQILERGLEINPKVKGTLRSVQKSTESEKTIYLFDSVSENHIFWSLLFESAHLLCFQMEHLLMNMNLRTSIISVRLPDKQLYVRTLCFLTTGSFSRLLLMEISLADHFLVGAQTTFRGLILMQSPRPTRKDPYGKGLLTSQS